MADVPMPRLSDSMEEGTIVKWLKSDGDEVRRGEEIVEIETDKANMTYEADDDGVLSIVASEGDTLPVGELIARIGEGGGGDGDEAARADEEPARSDEDRGEGGDGAAEPAAESGGDGEARSATAARGGEAQPDAEAGGDDSAGGEPAAEAGGDEGEDGEAQPAAEAGGGEGGDAQPGGDAAPERGRRPEPGAADGRDGDRGGQAAPARAGRDGARAGGEERLKVSPVARRLAREAGVTLEGISGTGPGGRIVKADVEAAAAEPTTKEEPAAKAEPAPEAEPAAEAPEQRPAPAATGAGGTAKGETTVEELSRLQQVVARRMAESKATAPDFHLTVEVDMEAAVDFRKQLKAAEPEGVAPSFNDFVVKAAALALREHPRANGAYRDGRFERYSRVNVGIAVAGAGALVVPTIFDADRKSLGEIAREARTLAERVRANEITPPELSGGTFTVSNLGMYGIRRFVAIINPPQAAILSVGSLEPRAVVRDGEIAARATLDLTLACDHRILYGAEAAEFLARIRERLEQPLMLAL